MLCRERFPTPLYKAPIDWRFLMPLIDTVPRFLSIFVDFRHFFVNVGRCWSICRIIRPFSGVCQLGRFFDDFGPYFGEIDNFWNVVNEVEMKAESMCVDLNWRLSFSVLVRSLSQSEDRRQTCRCKMSHRHRDQVLLLISASLQRQRHIIECHNRADDSMLNSLIGI